METEEELQQEEFNSQIIEYIEQEDGIETYVQNEAPENSNEQQIEFSNEEQYVITTEDGTIVQYVSASELQAVEHLTLQESNENDVVEQEESVTIEDQPIQLIDSSNKFIFKYELIDQLEENQFDSQNNEIQLEENFEEEEEEEQPVELNNLNEPMEFWHVRGQRDHTLLLYCNRQLYKRNRNKYYRCLCAPECEASGRVTNNLFQLLKPHNGHADQENMKNSFVLFNSLKDNSDKSNYEEVYEEWASKPTFSDVVDDTKKRLMTMIVLKRNRQAFHTLSNLLGNVEEEKNVNDERPYNILSPVDATFIDGLGIRSKVLFSVGHIYLHTNVKTYRCYLFPKCNGCGQYNFDSENFRHIFTLTEEHIKHGFKDTEKEILIFIANLRKRLLNSTLSVRNVYLEELEKDCYDKIRHRVSYNPVLRVLISNGTVTGKEDETQDEIESSESSNIELLNLNERRPFETINCANTGTVLYCDGQLYICNNRWDYYRCRLHNQGCPAIGVRVKNHFTLTRHHSKHLNQIFEKTKLQFIAELRERAKNEPNTPLRTIYLEEKEKPDYKSVAAILPFLKVSKLMKRARMLPSCESNETNDNVEETSENIPNATTSSADNDDNIDLLTNVTTEPVTKPDIPTVIPRVKNQNSIYTEYELMEGERLGSCILYTNEQLYTLNRYNYYRCRMYPQGCQATGMREGKRFRLVRDHSAHGSQEPERRRIILINTIKKRTLTNPDVSNFENVFNEECAKPEYADIVEKVSFTILLNNMRKIWKRVIQKDPKLKINILRPPEISQEAVVDREGQELKDIEDAEVEEPKIMTVEIGDNVTCNVETVPSAFTMIEGERLGSTLLYCKHQLYAHNHRNYYRCRLHSIGCSAAGVVQKHLFFLTRPHNGHGSQEREVRRLILIARIKRRVQIDPSPFHVIFNEESSKPEFSDVVDFVNLRKIHSTLERCRKRAANDVLEVVSPEIPADIEIKHDKTKIQFMEENEHGVEIWCEDADDSTIAEQTCDESNMVCEEMEENSTLVENMIQNPEEEPSVMTKVENESENEEFETATTVEEMDSTLEDYEKLNLSASLNFPENGDNYSFICGDRFGSRLLYSEGQLYCLNRDNYFRCRVYPNCIATGRIYGRIFRLHRGHGVHSLQTEEKTRLILMHYLKIQVQKDNTPIKQIFDEACAKPEFRDIASTVNYKTIFSTLMKCRNRGLFNTTTKEVEVDENVAIEETNKTNVSNNEYDTGNDNHPNQTTEDDKDFEIPTQNWDLETDSESDNEKVAEVPKPDMKTPTRFSLVQGDRAGSLILYSNGHLYTKNRGSYYRCRLHPLCYGSGNRRGNLFFMTRQHTDHPLQDDERSRLMLMASLKKRISNESTSMKVIYDEEIVKPEFAAISDLVSFKMLQSTLIKIRERLKFGLEPGTLTLSTETPCVNENLDDEDNLDNDNNAEESDNDDFVQPAKKTKTDNTEDPDGCIYFYILDLNENEPAEELKDLHFGDNITRAILNSPKDNLPSQPIVVYETNMDEQDPQEPSFMRTVHLPNEEFLDDNPTIESIQKPTTTREPIQYTIIEDCLNETNLLYAGKQLYIKQKKGVYACRVKNCQAIGETKHSMFHLLFDHNSHPLQNKIKLQLQLISRIRTRCITRRTARVSKIFREECALPKFRNVANTITLDGISEMVRRYRKKCYPRISVPLIDIENAKNLLSKLPPPIEFSIVSGTTRDCRLLLCSGALFYHDSKGVYRCHVKGCKAFGRRDRIFFQLLASHIDHENIDASNRKKFLDTIKRVEDEIKKRRVNETVTEADQSKSKDLNISSPVKSPQKTKSRSSNEINQHTLNSTQDGSNGSSKSILQQAWEELQVNI